MMSFTPDPPADDAARLLRGLTRLSRRLRADRAEQVLSPSKLSVLGTLLRGGAMSATELAAREGIQPQSLTRLLADLARRGLIAKVRSATDARRQEISLTAAGHAALMREMRRRHAWLAGAMQAGLTPAERRRLALAGDLLLRLAEGDARPAGGKAPSAGGSKAVDAGSGRLPSISLRDA